jgi:hypothetical protein
MATKNDITGDFLVSKPNSKQFEDNYDLIFGNKSALCDICGKDLKATKECAWTSCPLNWDEKRADVIGQNGNVGYE